MQSVLHRLVPLKINPSPFVLQSLSNLPIICLIQDAEHHGTTASYTLQKARFLLKFRVMINEFVSLFMPLVYAFLLSACAFLLLSIVLIVRKRSKNGAVPIPVGVSRKCAMIPKPITAPSQWWDKHPWMVFWGSFPLFYFLSGPLIAVIRPLLGLGVTAVFLSLLQAIVLMLCFSRGVFLIWKKSKIRAVLIGVGVPLMFVGILAAIAIPQFAAYDRAAYQSEISSNLRIAADAQWSYFDKNNSYKSCAPCTSTNLPGYDNRNPKVTLVAETGSTGFGLTATHENCGSSVWTYQSTTGKINRPSLKNGCKFRIKALLR